MFWHIPSNKNYTGLISISESECEIVDNTVDHFCSVKSSTGNSIFLHEVLNDPELMGKLVEHQPGAMLEFKSKLKHFERRRVEKVT